MVALSDPGDLARDDQADALQELVMLAQADKAHVAKVQALRQAVGQYFRR